MQSTQYLEQETAVRRAEFMSTWNAKSLRPTVQNRHIIHVLAPLRHNEVP